MTELKPAQQYVTEPGNGQGLAKLAIEEQSQKAAMARAMIENEKRDREQRCGAEIDEAITAILKKHRCSAKFCELREGGQTTRIWLQPIAVNE